FVLLLLAAIVTGPMVGRGDVADDRMRAKSLVQELGNGSFVTRKRAMNNLVKMGLPALAALEAGATSPNREISYRCQRVLIVVRDLDLQRRLVLFLRDDDTAKYKLPGWTQFEGWVGNSPETRQVFVAMQKADAPLMLEMSGKGSGLPEMIRSRLLSVQRRGRLHPGELGIGMTSAILFAVADERVPITQELASRVYGMAIDTRVRGLLGGDDGAARTMRVLLARGLRRQQDTDPYPALMVSMQYELKEALTFAKRVLAVGKRSANARKMALLGINRFGNAEDIARVEPLLEDKSVVPLPGRKQEVKLQVRDIALATLLTLAKLDHKTHGFAHVRLDQLHRFDVSSLQFASDGDRQAALDRWAKEKPSAGKTGAAGDARP
ncbi:MAG: hypothetical protein ABGX05_10000, partial [Pirellulaceae bacterium]